MEDILVYLGKHRDNRIAWNSIKATYGAVIKRLPNRRVWARSEEIDAFDDARSVPASASRYMPGYPERARKKLMVA